MTRTKAWLEKLEKKPKLAWIIQFVKFGLVGATNTAISYGIYALLIYIGAHYLIASIVSFVISVAWSYMLNSRYVFKKEDGEIRAWWKALLKTYISYALTGLILANILLYIWIDLLGVNEYLAPVINLIITIPLNFILNKFWAFGKKQEHGR